MIINGKYLKDRFFHASNGNNNPVILTENGYYFYSGASSWSHESNNPNWMNKVRSNLFEVSIKEIEWYFKNKRGVDLHNIPFYNEPNRRLRL